MVVSKIVPNILKIFKNIDLINEKYNILNIICSYDNSTDKTLLEFCKQKKKYKNLEIIINKEPVTKSRTVNISNARNRILDYIDKNNLSVDYLILMDFDDVCSKNINMKALEEAFNIKNEWDIITFMNEKYYDYWALSFDNFIYSCWHNSDPKKIIRKMRDELYSKIKGKKYIECHSSFNGFGIFKYDKIKKIRYKSDVNNSLYLNFYKKNMNIIERLTNTNYMKNNCIILDCEHRYYQILCKKLNKTKNIILNQNIFPKYDGEHASFL